MAKNRDRLSIVASILFAAHSGSSKTHIMQKANLSYKLLEKYLDSVVGADLLRIDGSKYSVTDNGRALLKRYSDYQERCNEAEKFLKNMASERQKLLHLCENKAIRKIAAE